MVAVCTRFSPAGACQCTVCADLCRVLLRTSIDALQEATPQRPNDLFVGNSRTHCRPWQPASFFAGELPCDVAYAMMCRCNAGGAPSGETRMRAPALRPRRAVQGHELKRERRPQRMWLLGPDRPPPPRPRRVRLSSAGDPGCQPTWPQQKWWAATQARERPRNAPGRRQR